MNAISYIGTLTLTALFTFCGNHFSAQDYKATADRICKYINEETSDKNDIINLINQRASAEKHDISILNVHHHMLQKELYRNCTVFEKFNWSLQGDSYLLDIQNTLALNEKKEINQILQSISTQQEMDVYIITINDYVDQKDLNQFSYTFLTQNDNKKGNGNLVIIYDKESRNIRISTSYKANPIITDRTIQGIINNHLIPTFKDKQYFKGFKNALLEIQKINNDYILKTRL